MLADSASVLETESRRADAPLLHERPKVGMVEHANQSRDLAVERDRETNDRREARNFDAALHVTDVRASGAGGTRELLLRHAALLTQFPESRPEQLCFGLRFVRQIGWLLLIFRARVLKL